MSDVSESRGILASSAVMASGTVVSRMSGYVRNLLLAAAIGNAVYHATGVRVRDLPITPDKLIQS